MAEGEGPQDGDYIVFDTGPLGMYTGVSVAGGAYLGAYFTEDGAYESIAGSMKREGYRPDVWKRDDHGGLTLVSSGV